MAGGFGNTNNELSMSLTDIRPLPNYNLQLNINSMADLNESSHAAMLGHESEALLKKQTSDMGFSLNFHPSGPAGASMSKQKFFQQRMSNSRGMKYNPTHIEEHQMSGEADVSGINDFPNGSGF